MQLAPLKFWFIFTQQKLTVMLTSIKGYYDKGKVVLSEPPPIEEKTDEIITFLTEKLKNVEMLKKLFKNRF